ncbi:MAG TPA: YdeI/OmpD-associated family protein [Pirellulales bacterium]|nr:YdeI/OmpD-associated family protein [Pirellulales bacterium]
MGKKDARVDAYIAKSAEFAQPILRRLRDIVHSACPEVEETIKWKFPNFMYKGMLCHMAAFKQHCAFGFWHKAVRDAVSDGNKADGMGQLGRITSLDELPSETTLKRQIKQAMKLNDAGVKSPRPKPKAKKPAQIPDDVKRALKKHKQAGATFEAFSPSHRREYIEWIVEAKQPATRDRRIATMVEWLAEGKSRNWKYERK